MFRTKRIISVICALLLVAFTFSACTGKDEETPKPSASAPHTEGESNDNANDSEEPLKVTYPIKTDEKVTLKYWIPMPGPNANYVSEWGETEIYQEIMERTGVDIEFVHPAGGQEREQYNVLVASGELPDIICGNLWGRFFTGGASAGVEEGIFVDLTDYVPTYAPDYYRLITEDEYIYRTTTDDEGRISAFTRLLSDDQFPNWRLMVRNDILDEIEMDIPKLISDYDKMFEKVKALGVTPYYLSPKGYELLFMQVFDVAAGMYMDESGTVKYGQIQPAFKEYLELMNDWYSKGYIKNDFIAITENDLRADFDSKKTAMIAESTDLILTRAKLQGYEFSALPYPRMEEGQQIHFQSQSSPYNRAGTNEWVVSTSSKHPEVAVQFLNYLYTEEGAMLANYGIEGKSYEMVEGKPQFTDYMLNNPDIDGTAAQNMLKLHAAPKLSDPDQICNPNVVRDEESLAIRTIWADDPNVDGDYVLPSLTFSLNDSSAISEIMTEVNTYVDEMVLKFITGATPLSEFDNFVQKVEAMGIQEAVDIHQQAYDRMIQKELPKQ